MVEFKDIISIVIKRNYFTYGRVTMIATTSRQIVIMIVYYQRSILSHSGKNNCNMHSAYV